MPYEFGLSVDEAQVQHVLPGRDLQALGFHLRVVFVEDRNFGVASPQLATQLECE
jgi:hypothetical protein